MASDTESVQAAARFRLLEQRSTPPSGSNGLALAYDLRNRTSSVTQPGLTTKAMSYGQQPEAASHEPIRWVSCSPSDSMST